MTQRVRLRRSTLVVAIVLVACALGESFEAEQATGTIRGLVKVDSIPEKVMVAVTTDQAVCGDQVEDQVTQVDPSGGVANAVVVVTGLEWAEAPPAPVINNQECYFVPRVQVAQTRSQIEVQSSDDTLHTTHAYDDRQRTTFNVAIPLAGMKVTRPLRRPGVVRLECDSHGWMRGWVYVTNDVAVVTGSDGRFQLTGVAPGTYELAIWHERYEGSMQMITVTAGTSAQVDFTLQEPRGP